MPRTASYLFPQRALRVAKHSLCLATGARPTIILRASRPQPGTPRHMDIHNHVTFRTLLAEDSSPDRCAYFFVLFADVLTQFFVRSQVR
jgi:hypothetical protein